MIKKMEVDDNFNLDQIQDLYQLNDVDASFKQKCAKLAEDIISKNVAITQLIESLGVFLLDSASVKREFGVQFLTEVLSRLPHNFLRSEQLSVICTFFCDKLKDHQQVLVAALKGTLIIIQFEHFPSSSISHILTSLFHTVTCQQQQQADRHNVYKIFEICLQRFPNEIKAMGLEFVYGVISAIDGERDPRNLLYLFSWIRLFLQIVTLAHLKEEMFEVLACYFPVDFKTPPNDQNAITRDRLAQALCPCLCALPDFAEYCLPLALEKLDSSLQVAKLDSLELLEKGCKNFTVDSYLSHSSEVWSSIQKQILNSSDPQVINKCLQTLTSVICKLSEAEHVTFIKILKDIVDTLKNNLIPNSKLYGTSALILVATSSASAISAEYVTKHIAAQLQNTFTMTNEPKERAVILNTLINLSKNYQRYHDVKLTDVDELAIIPMLCLKATVEPDNESNDLKSAGFKAFSNIAKQLANPVLDILLKRVHELIIEDLNEHFRKSLLCCFKSLAVDHSSDVEQKVFYNEMLKDPSALKFYLKALCTIADMDYFRETVVDTILNYMFNDVNLSDVAINVINDVLASNTDNKKIIETLLQKNVMNHLIDFTIAKEAYNIAPNVSKILKLLLATQTKACQQKYVNVLIHKIDSQSRDRLGLYAPLMIGVLTNLHIGLQYDSSFVDFMTELSTNLDDGVPEVNTVAQIFATFINKVEDTNVLDVKLRNIQEFCKRSSSNNKIIVLSWVIKALLMRNARQALLWSNEFLDMLDAEPQIAEGLEIIMNDKCDVLNVNSHCNVTPLYRQKFFYLAATKIRENYKLEKSNYLLAIGYLLKHAPTQAVIMQFEKILGLILTCLERCENAEVLEILLFKLQKFIKNKETVIENHIEDFLFRILNLTGFKSSMNVRIAALHCISKFTECFPIYKLVPLKQRVVQQLEISLDDNKRLVRRQAMEARSLWFLLDSD